MITILTRPLPTDKLTTVKFFLLDLLSLFWPQVFSRWGHYEVVRSLRRGLKLNKFDFSYNPLNKNSLTNTVWVLSDLVALEQMIKLKNSGHIQHLLAGPNLVVIPTDHDSLIANPSIDKVIVPSAWVADFYLDQAPELKDRLLLWPAGVSESYWQPDPALDKNTILIYRKAIDQKLVDQTIEIISNLGFSYQLIEYGKYRQSHYKALLNQSFCAVFLSPSESQGLALAEAWAMDVPTFCYDPKLLTYQNLVWRGASSCPYLSEDTGKTWQEPELLKSLLEALISKQLQFQPRSWLLSNLTDQKSAQIMVDQLKKFDI